MSNQEQVSGEAVKGSGGGFVRAGTPESEALHVEGSYFAAHHIGGTTWRFGSGDEAKDDLVGTITLAPHGATTYGLANARWIVNALDQVKRQAKEDERRKFENFDFLCDFAAKYLDRHHPSDVPLICDPDSPDPGPRLAAALRDCLAATQSTPKGSES